MIRRPAVTLIEVLVSMFIMAIGMLALLVLFPLGAINMSHALRDDRCASAAAMAENVAIIADIRHDPMVTAQFTAGHTLVYVDPYGSMQSVITPAFVTLGGVIPRINTSFTATPQLADRWFSLPDDIAFFENGTPQVDPLPAPAVPVIDRGRRYSYTYLLSLPQPTTNMVQLFVVVYSGRPMGSLALETTLPVVPAPAPAGTNGLTIASGTSIKRGGWILDPINGHFYRVTNLDDVGGFTTLEVQPNLIANVSAVTIMDNVAEVFDKGTSWQP